MNMFALADPTFVPGSVHTATIVFNNTKDVAIDYKAELYLRDGDGVKQATSGFVNFSIASLGSKNVAFTITMPSIPGNYIAWIDVYVNDVLNVQFVSGVPVTIEVAGLPDFHFKSFGVAMQYFGYESSITARWPCHVVNEGEVAGTYIVQLWGRPSNTGEIELWKEEIITLAPGEEWWSDWSSFVTVGLSGTIWATGEWGEETIHLSYANNMLEGPAYIWEPSVTSTSATIRFRTWSEPAQLTIISPENITILPMTLSAISGGLMTVYGLTPSTVYSVKVQENGGDSYTRSFSTLTSGGDPLAAGEVPSADIWITSYVWDVDPSILYPGILHGISIDLHHYLMGEGVQPINYVFNIALVDPVTDNVVAVSDSLSVLVGGSGHGICSFPIITPSELGTFQVVFRAYRDGTILDNLIVLGEATVIELMSPIFVYSNELGGHVTKSNSNYSWLKYECDITNPTGATVTETITLWHSNWEGTITEKGYLDACNSGYGRCPVCKDPGQIVLTLAPGQSYHYRFCGFNCSTSYASQDRLWLRDDRGGESAHKSC